MRFNVLSRTHRATPRKIHRFPHRLLLERLEDRVVPANPPDGTILVATLPSQYSPTDQSSHPTGIVGVDPNTGAQFLFSGGLLGAAGNLFKFPTYITENPQNQKVYVSDVQEDFDGPSYGGSVSGTTNTLSDTNTITPKNWPTNQWAGATVIITGGTGTGQTRTVVSNTAKQLTISGNWTTIPNSTSSYTVRLSGAIIAVDPSSGAQSVLASGGLINGPNVLLFQHNSLVNKIGRASGR